MSPIRSAKLRYVLLFAAATILWLARPEAQARPPSPLDVEARTEAQRFWDKILSKCGPAYYYADHYVALEAPILIEYRDVTFTVLPPKPLSRADQLNGTEYTAIAVMIPAAFRYIEWTGGAPSSRWSDWIEGPSLAKITQKLPPPGPYLSDYVQIGHDPRGSAAYGANLVWITKTHGIWSFEASRFVGTDPDKIAQGKPSCQMIPGATSPRN